MNAEAILRLVHNRETRTCKIWLNKFEQTFSRTSDSMYTHASSPHGPCGVVNIATLERDRSLWNYRTKKVVTNRQGMSGPISCKLLDETEHLYTWNNTVFYKGCDYVKYGIF